MQQIKQIPRQILGNTNQKVSKIGYGCMGLSVFYGTPVTTEQGLEIIGKAIDQGQNFFDTAYFYGENEQLLGKAIQKFGRDKFFLATKVPPMQLYKENGEMKTKFIPATKENIFKYCDESLKRLNIDQIDLYYQHRVDPNIPIEDQAQSFKELIGQGKIKYYGLSESSEDSIRRAHKIHPITAIQEEYSLQTRDIEKNGILKACQELGIALVAYSPLGRGFLTGSIDVKNLDKNDHRQHFPRFQEEQAKKNQVKLDTLTKIANNLEITVGQLALAWILAYGNNIFPIPGTKSEKYLIQNQNAASIVLEQDIINQINELFPLDQDQGLRYSENLIKHCNITTVQKQ